MTAAAFDAVAEVDAAARYLDVAHPGWFTRIDTGTLAMSSCTACIIGQAIAPLRVGYSWGDEVAAILGGEDFIFDHPAAMARVGFSARVFAEGCCRAHWVTAIQHRQQTFTVPQPALMEVRCN